MKRLLLTFALLSLVAGASADPNDLADGVLITHTPAGHVFSPGADYCADYGQYGITSCVEQNTNMASQGYAQHMFFYVVAAFAEDKVWCGTQFGIGDVTGSDEYFYFVAGGDANICLPNALSTTSGAGFPMEHEGIAIVATDTPWAGNFLPVYWAECYSYYGGGDYNIPLATYPGDPPLAVFGNCEVPSLIWDIECLGAMGVGNDPGQSCCPVAPPTEGACCLQNGDCLDVDEADCLAQDGVWYGLGTDCATTDCPQPVGACCFEDGSCDELTRDDCLAAGGDYTGDGYDCDEVDCPQPFGACCFEDGSCQDIPEADCIAQNGAWEGMGTECATTDCPQPPEPGACCFEDGSCQDLIEADCLAQSGVWEGAGTDCATTECPQQPLAGACCFEDGHCEFILEADCDVAGGAFTSEGLPCDPNPCGQPDVACCLDTGECIMATADDCLAQGGVPEAYPSSCDPNPCDQPDGACCFPDGSCQDLTEAGCIGLDGVWEGPDTACATTECPQPDEPGACCFADGTCQFILAVECETVGGVFYGEGVTCEPDNPCPQPTVCCVGADCYIVYSEQECIELQGEHHPDMGSCDPNPCEIVPASGDSWGSIKALYR